MPRMTTDLAKVRLFGAVVRPLQAFLRLEAASGIVLLVSAVLALLWANLDPSSYREVFDLPALAALGGMVVPAVVFLSVNAGGPGRAGWGVPVATDIAFCVGILTLLKDRVPHALVCFVTALAIFDDIGGIL